MKKILPILVIITKITFSQEIVILDSVILPKNFKNVFVGEKENIYAIDTNKKNIYKIEKNIILSYSNIIMGNIDDLSVLNENYFIVSFKEFNGIEFLSNKLKRRNFLDFNNDPKLNPSIVVGGEFYNIWIYEKKLNKLIYFNSKKKKEIFRTEELLFIYGSPFEPIKMISTPNRVWLISKRGIIEVNIKGQISNIFRYSNIENVFAFNREYIGFILKDKIVLKSKTKVIELENKFRDYKKIFAYKNKLFVVYDKKVEICKIKLPD